MDTGLRAMIKEDFEVFADQDPEKPRGLRLYFDILTHPGFWSVVTYRLAALAHRKGLLPVARVLFLVNMILWSVELSPRAEIGPGLLIPHPQGVGVGAGVRIGRHAKILKGTSIGAAGYGSHRRDGMPIIGDDCIIFDGAKVLGPIEIGDGCRVGAGVILMKSMPAGSTVVLHQQTRRVLAKQREA